MHGHATLVPRDEVNRPGVPGDFISCEGWSHGRFEEVPGRLRERAVRTVAEVRDQYSSE